MDVMNNTAWTGRLPPELDRMSPAKPADPGMRESASIWLFEENGAFALPRNGLEAQGAVWENHRFDCNFAFADGPVLRESTRAPTHPSIDAESQPTILGAGPMTFRCVEPFRKWRVTYEGEAYASEKTLICIRLFAVSMNTSPSSG